MKDTIREDSDKKMWRLGSFRKLMWNPLGYTQSGITLRITPKLTGSNGVKQNSRPRGHNALGHL